MNEYTFEIIADDPDHALFETTRLIQERHPRESRNGPTFEFPGIANIVYRDPLQRVLFDEIRDCNPFFALFESLWMLGGRQDLASITYFNSKFGQYSDDGKFIRGSAYGVRWRSWFGHDQLAATKKRFEDEGVATRRAVIMQWDAATDPVVDSKDVPCNTQCCLLMRERDGEQQLDLTVFNRSNDVIFGTFGSNVVHFSMFLEYMAKMLGLPVGMYFQVSNCLHIYTEFPIYKKVAPGILAGGLLPRSDYRDQTVVVSPMFMGDATLEQFDSDCDTLLDSHAHGLETRNEGLSHLSGGSYQTAFFREVALPMMRAWKLWKETKDPLLAMDGEHGLGQYIEGNPNPHDWIVAGYEWLQRRAVAQATRKAGTE